jgi:bifunctional UDP-N-acetylglucosamine pyrophosphorylase/glucosamine-1-phosphate N-acetyltransferase
MMALPLIRETAGTVLVVCGDTPLLQAGTLSELLKEHQCSRASCTVLTARMPDPFGYGRIIRDPEGRVSRIVEQKDAYKGNV